MPYPPFNPYGRPAMSKTPEQLQQELDASLNQYRNMYYNNYPQSGYNQPTPSSRPNVRSGEYIEVDSYKEVEEAPTKLDGTPTLFVNSKDRVFWSKQFINGAHSIQAYSYAPVLGYSPAKEETQVDYVTELEQESDSKPDERFEKLENKFDKLEAMLEKLIEKGDNNGTNRYNKEFKPGNGPQKGTGASPEYVSKEVSGNGGSNSVNDKERRQSG